MEKKFIKLGIMGCWRGFDAVVGSKDDERLCVRALCDKDAEKLEKAKKEFEAAPRHGCDLLICDTYEDLLATDIDAVYIANYAPEHVPFVIKALEAGKHVISEIPSVFSMEQAKQLKDAVKAHPDLVYMCAENCCYWAFIEAWKKMYEDGRLGEIVYAEAEYMHAAPPEEFKPLDPNHWRTSLDAIFYITHELGPLLYIMHDRVRTITCLESGIRYNPYKKGSETGVALMKTEKGAIIRIMINFGAYVGFDHNYRLCGTRGTVQTDANSPLDTAHTFAAFYDVPGSIDKKIELPLALSNPGESTVGHGGAEPKMIGDFLDCLLSGTKPPLDVDFALDISLPGILAHESAVNGGTTIEMPKID